MLEFKIQKFSIIISLIKNFFKTSPLAELSGLPHTQGTQGIQGNSVNFQVEENLRETKGILIYFLNSGNF